MSMTIFRINYAYFLVMTQGKYKTCFAVVSSTAMLKINKKNCNKACKTSSRLTLEIKQLQKNHVYCVLKRVPQLDQRQKVALVAFVAFPFLRRRRNFVAFVGVLLKVAAGGVDDALEEIPHKLLNLLRLRFAAVSPRHILQTGEELEVVAAAVADAIALWLGPFSALQRVDVLCEAGVAGLLVAVHALGHDDDAVLALALPVAVLLDGSAVGEEDDVAELFCSALQALANVLLHLRDVVLDCSEKRKDLVFICIVFVKTKFFLILTCSTRESAQMSRETFAGTQ